MWVKSPDETTNDSNFVEIDLSGNNNSVSISHRFGEFLYLQILFIIYNNLACGIPPN